MICDAEVADCSDGDFADMEGGPVLSFDELAVPGPLAAAEERPLSMLQRGFGGERIVAVAERGLAAPGEGGGGFPAGRDLIGPHAARRQALLVDAGLELLGIGEMAPAALEGEGARRVPGQADRGRIQRAGLDVPTVLVGLAPVEAADLELDPV